MKKSSPTVTSQASWWSHLRQRATRPVMWLIRQFQKIIPAPLPQKPIIPQVNPLHDAEHVTYGHVWSVHMWSMSTRQSIIFWLVGLAVVYLGYMGYQILDLIYLIFAWLVISIAMETIITRWGRRLPRGVAIGVSYVLLLLFIIIGMMIMIPFVLQQISQMLAVVIQYFYVVQSDIASMGLIPYIEYNAALPDLIKHFLIDNLQSSAAQGFDIQNALLANISNIVTTGSSYATQAWSRAVSLVSSLLSFIGQIGLVLTVAVFFSIEKERVVWRFASLTTSDQAMTTRLEKVRILYTKMGLWIKSQLSLCVYIGIIVYVALWILDLFGIDIPNKGTLAIIAWFTEFIPYVGPLLGGLPAVIMGTTLYGLRGFIIVSIVYYIVQWTENNVLIPTLMKKSLGVSPLVVFLCMLVAWSILGFVGVVLAVPIAVILTLVTERE